MTPTPIEEIVTAIEAYDVKNAFALIEEHRAVYEYHPDFITARAMLCLQVQEYKSACEILLNGVSKFPTDVDLLFNLGHAYQCDGDVKQAVEYYMRAIQFTNDTNLIAELEQLCSDIISSPEFVSRIALDDSKDTDNTYPGDRVKIEVQRITSDETKNMNVSTISFISCVNDEEQYIKMLNYISNLEVPYGYKIECLSVRNASSMTEGYNAAMEESAAKYKIYLHQDVYILNKRFIFDVLDIFQSNEDIGLIGVVGSKNIPGTCKWWNDYEKLGCIIDMWTGQERLDSYGAMASKWAEASIVDGLLIATQYDVKWRSDLFDGWHLYDGSQCCEFRRLGYTVAVANQVNEEGEVTPWCLHNSVRPSTDDYLKYCSIFRKEYWRMLDFGISLELGCGRTKMDGFLGIDRFDLPGVDIVADLNKEIPLRDNSVSRVYACHSLEHLDDLSFIMSEIYRVCEHGAIVTIFAPYYLQSTNLSNPFHKHVFLETTFRAYTSAKTTLIDKREYAIPHAPDWGIGESDNSVCDVDFRTLRLDFTYLPDYYLYSDDELRFFRHSRYNVCEMILYNLAVVKNDFTQQDEQKCLKKAFIPPIFWHYDRLRTQAVQRAKMGENT